MFPVSAPKKTISIGRTVGVRLALAACLLGLGATVRAQNATIHIQADKPAHAVPPTFYGMMTEEINYSYDGGLYAELVRNRAFQQHDWSGLADWYVVEKGDASSKFAIDKDNGPSDALTNSLKVTLHGATPQNPAGVLNDGYWGMAARPNATYTGSFYAKTDDPAIGPIRVALVNDATGEALASATVPSIGTGWAQATFTMKTGNIKPSGNNHLEITAGHDGTLWLQLVSLMPPTYKGRINGNRPDLMEKLAGLHPQFLRFPGGNYLEGDEIWQRYDWKATIGKQVDRPTHPSPWNYHSSDGLGFLEFLEWCEDLKIDPVLAVYAGYSMKQQHVAPGADLEMYVNDALDELEYVTGDTSTKWGAVRARDGHPAPFKLHYVEIGNEDFFDKSGSYGARYKQFYKAIKAKYPELQLIATDKITSMKPDVIDDHYYLRTDEMIDMNRKYDAYDRSGPKIFLGEWATREGSPTTNFGAALGDATLMTSMERNSDLIVMAAYAPLLVNVNPGGMQWASDLIGYDALNSYGSPSYYAQSMFGANIGTEMPTNTAENLPARFFYSVTEDRSAGAVFVKLVNASTTPRRVDLAIDGLAKSGKVTVTTLSAPNTQATNDIDHPTAIVPVESKPVKADAHMTHTVPGFAIQVLRFDLK